MFIHFSIKYLARWGQKLSIVGSTAELGNWNEDQSLELSAINDDTWDISISVDSRKKDFLYYYLVKDQDGTVIRREWKRMHHLIITEPYKSIYIQDRWFDTPCNSPFYTSAFYEVFFPHSKELKRICKRTLESKKIILQLYAPTVHHNERVYITGESEALGNWKIQEAIPLSYIDRGEWCAEIELSPIEKYEELFFKFFIAGEKYEMDDIRWETGSNRCLKLPAISNYDALYIQGYQFSDGTYLPRFSGVVIPLFSLRSYTDFGIGDFGCLKRFIGTAQKASMHIIQLLPINDTTFSRSFYDSYPYNAISSDAINPIYIDLSALSPLKDAEVEAHFQERAEMFRTLMSLDYTGVSSLKQEYLRLHFKENAEKVMRKKPYRDFRIFHEEWLLPYVAFCLLRDNNPGKMPHEWGEYATYDKYKTLKYIEFPANIENASYYFYVQYLLHIQLKDVCEYAEKKHIVLKGDIPIGVSPHSVETWTKPHLFNLNYSAGAPPDDFAPDGQNWGFPTYNWNAIEYDHFDWWRNRFKRMSTYFKAFRIDHILGFFRIWEIPKNQISGLLGRFNPALPLCGDEIINFGANVDFRYLDKPLIHLSDLNDLFEKDVLSYLIQSNILIKVDIPDTYTLKWTNQVDYQSLDKDKILGGQTTISTLMHLCTEVAFIQDKVVIDNYHPRIAFHKSLMYSHWSYEERQCWDKMAEYYYVHRNINLWKDVALKRLIPILESSDMLVCAEDLGMIPLCVPEVLHTLNILSLDLERMPKKKTFDNFTDLYKLPYHSVCTTSTHDMPSLRAWYEQLSEKEQRDYHIHIGAKVISSSNTYVDPLYYRIVYNHMHSNSMLAILPLIDWMSIDKRLHLLTPKDEQINHPENPAQNWNFRVPLYIEDLENNYPEWIEDLKYLIHSAHRQ
ncbi:4-alpha-glucanotransferase [Porphyromonas pogonae]|uniref:4-alpha-glucanotransferase n=1 Tax=Porphyromonas pogonae TaxID=867595 RepID=UPI002E79FA02|nr:4-alpha-glucanotransferase [Porphyromonas pogonae]